MRPSTHPSAWKEVILLILPFSELSQKENAVTRGSKDYLRITQIRASRYSQLGYELGQRSASKHAVGAEHAEQPVFARSQAGESNDHELDGPR